MTPGSGPVRRQNQDGMTYEVRVVAVPPTAVQEVVARRLQAELRDLVDRGVPIHANYLSPNNLDRWTHAFAVTGNERELEQLLDTIRARPFRRGKFHVR